MRRSCFIFVWRVFLLSAVGLWLAACAAAPDGTPALRLTLAPPTAQPTATRAAWPTLTPHVFCAGVAESFLIVGERGRVTLTNEGQWLNLRAGPSTQFEVIAQLAPLESFMVLAGPRCGGPFAWYQIAYRETVGWIAEGYEGQYYAEPWLPG